MAITTKPPWQEKPIINKKAPPAPWHPSVIPVGGIPKPPIVSKPKPKPIKPSGKPFDQGTLKRKLTPFESYLNGDATYLQQFAGFNKAQGNFLADQNLDRSQYMQGYASTSRDLGMARTEQNRDLKDEFAGRGMLRSGVYNTSYGDLSKKFNNQTADLNSQKTSFLARLQRELTKFKDEQQIAKQQAVADAARRRAERLSL